MRKSGRKLLGVMLAVSLAITSASPIQGAAAEQNDSECQSTESGRITSEEGQQPAASSQDGASAKENQSPSAGADERQQPITSGQDESADAAAQPSAGQQEAGDGISKDMQQPAESGQDEPSTDESQRPAESGQDEPSTDESQRPAAPGQDKPSADGMQQPNPGQDKSSTDESSANETQQPANDGQDEPSADEGQSSAAGTDIGQQPTAPDQGQASEASKDGSQNPDQQLSTDVQSPQPEDTAKGQQPEAGAAEEDAQIGEDSEASEKNMQPTGEEGLPGGAEQSTFMLPQREGAEDILPLDGSYDINQPVIERFELVENGQTLTQEDTVHFNLYVYDSDSDVKSIAVELLSTRYGSRKMLEFIKSSEENLYTAQLSASQLWESNFVVSSIRVEDERNNYVEGKVRGEDGQYLYQFTIQNKPQEGSVTLSDLKMEKNASNADGTLNLGDSVTYTAKLQCEGVNVDWVRMYYQCQAHSSHRRDFEVTYDRASGNLSGTFLVDDKIYPEEWELYKIEVHSSKGGYYNFDPKDIAPDTDVSFTVDQQYDLEPPVIESIEIGENGRVVKAGEKVEIRVKVKEDNPEKQAYVRFRAAVYGKGTKSVSLSYHADTCEYVGEVAITDQTYPCRWNLDYLEIDDKNGNRALLSDFKGDGQEDCARYYIVAPGDYDEENPVVTGITLERNGETVKAGERLTLKVEADEQNPSVGTAWFSLSTISYATIESVDLRYDETAKAYIGTVKIEASTHPGEWRLSQLLIKDRNNNTTNLTEGEGLEEKGACSFHVDEAGYDVEGPVIQSITIDKNGQFVKPGETLDIRIKIEDQNPDENKVFHAYFKPQVTNVSASLDVALRYNRAQNEYVGSIPITDDTYPCEWALKELDLKDKYGNRYSMSQELSSWSYTKPWYFKVKSGNTYREDVKNVTFNISGLMEQEDGSYAYGNVTRTAENVGRRATLKQLGVLPKAIEGVVTTWNYNWWGIQAGEDTELLFDSTEDMNCYLSASYDKGCANVSLTYVSEQDGQKTVVIPVFIDREATYKDVLAALELPKDAKADDFAEFLLSYSDSTHNWNTRVGDVTSVSAVADYKSCQVTWNARYIGQDSQEISQPIATSYREGTTVAEALAELEPPQDVMGMEGEGWMLLGADSDQVLPKEMVSFDLVALYSGRTTLDVSYTYRGEDGIIAGGSKLLAVEGENLSEAEIQGEATNAFKDANHLSGLILSEWAGESDIAEGRYKKIRFQAQYYNCVVVLKYPDESCQYVVVDKNSKFTLPTESEFYTDILWEGFAQGQTVTITEDREFLASDAKRKDGTQEVPAGERLTEEEIAKIKEEIEKAEAGTSVKIDMKKATVVPKEVLEAIKGKAIDLVVDMGSYSWSIDGTEVNATALKDIDLEVTIGTDQVPSALVSSIAEGKPVTQLSLTHNGEFGFRANLTLNLGSENSGSYGNLYYYDSSGKLVFRNAGQIGADGSTTLSFSHASDYVAVVDKVMHTGAGANQDPTGGSDDGTDNGETSGGSGNSDSPTGGADHNDSELPGGSDDGDDPTGGSGNDGDPTDGADRSDPENEADADGEDGDERKEPDEDREKEDISDKDDRKKDDGSIIPSGPEKKVPKGLTDEEAEQSDKDDTAATKEKNSNSVTADSGRTRTGAQSLKSPKTGE